MVVGFFLAGLLLSESRFRGHYIGNLRGLHLLFGAFFFVPLGMLSDPRFVVAHAPLVLLGAGGVLLLKAGIVTSSMLVRGRSSQAAFNRAWLLAPVGERAFVLFVMAGSPAVAPSLEELDLLRRFGVLVVAVWRGDLYLSTLPPDFQPKSGDRLVVSGREEELSDCEVLFQGSPNSPL